ncbi:UNVERIFIED_CONTAM: hypothetical protein PYX00_000502 [Menopon gallinae]|uniref:tRNA wybutosine-synthesizing protein 4 n=1 Tax=Menopon gallinae TaxID=328185 RepID=A0AAW2IAN6_9NEOP
MEDQIPYKSVPILEAPPLELIMERTKERKPFLIRNFDIGPCKSEWTPEYMSQKMGSTPVKIHVSIHPKLDFINKNFLYKTLPFDELLTRISSRKSENHFIQENELYYLRSLGSDRRGKDVANFMNDFPELAHDLKFPKVFDEAAFFSAILRISSAGIQIWTHYDIMDNILIQIRGKKKIILWPPSEVEYLYLMGDKSKVIDVERGHPEKYPKFIKAARYQCLLEEGDIIFIPALWFHNITALEMSVGVNIFWKNLPDDFYDKKDTYGNKDLTVATKAFSALENSIKALDTLPFEYKDFYLKRMVQMLQEKLESIN